MLCRSRPQPEPRRRVTALGAPLRDPAARIGDVDRQRTADVLGDATAAGYLRLDELDERLAAVWSATTSAQLSAVASDLPAELQRAGERRETARAARPAARAHLASYVGVMLLLVAVWLVLGISGEGWYPWPVWPALGWGIGVVRHLRVTAGEAW